MKTPLVCTNDTLFHIDYGTPLIANKSTDYRTSAKKYHEFRPSFPQHFDCRIKPRIHPDLLKKDMTIREEEKSTYQADFVEKNIVFKDDKNARAEELSKVGYMRNVQEKMFENPPMPKGERLSEMKEAFQRKYWHEPDGFKLPSLTCEMLNIGKAVQPAIKPECKGYTKLLDIYLSENRAKFIPYTQEQIDTAQADLPTFYNVTGKWKGFKGELPGRSGFKNVYDKRIFKREYPNRFLSTASKRVPNFGMQSEYTGHYILPASSDFYPYVREYGEFFPDSLPGPGPWQNLCPAGMYCSEYCHVGSGWPVNAVVDTGEGRRREVYVHDPCCEQIVG